MATGTGKKTYKHSAHAQKQKKRAAQQKGSSGNSKKKKRKSTDSNSTPDSAVTDTSKSRSSTTRKRTISPTKTSSRSGSPSTKKNKASSTSVDKSGGDELGVARGRTGDSASSSSAKSSGGKSAGDESSVAGLEKSAITKSIEAEAHVNTDDEGEENPLLVDTAAKSTAEIMPSSPVPKVLQYFESEERKINNSMWPFLWALQYNENEKIEVGMPDVNHNDMDINLALGILCSVCGIPAIGSNGRSSNETKLHLEPGTDVKVMMVPFVDDKAKTVSADNQSFIRQFSFPDSLFYSPL